MDFDLCIFRGKYVAFYKSLFIFITDEQYQEVLRPMVRLHQSYDVGLFQGSKYLQKVWALKQFSHQQLQAFALIGRKEIYAWHVTFLNDEKPISTLDMKNN